MRLLIPDIDVVKLTYRGVQKGNKEDFDDILRWYNYCEKPKTLKERKSISLIKNAFKIGKEKFKEI